MLFICFTFQIIIYSSIFSHFWVFLCFCSYMFICCQFLLSSWWKFLVLCFFFFFQRLTIGYPVWLASFFFFLSSLRHSFFLPVWWNVWKNMRRFEIKLPKDLNFVGLDIVDWINTDSWSEAQSSINKRHARLSPLMWLTIWRVVPEPQCNTGKTMKMKLSLSDKKHPKLCSNSSNRNTNHM